MRFEALYRASLYVMLVLAAAVLNVDPGPENRYAWLFPLVVAIAAVVAFVTIDLRGAPGLPQDVATLLTWGAYGLFALEYWSNPVYGLFIGLGHLMIYFVLIKTFRAKTVEDDWFLFVLGLVQVVIGVHLSQTHDAIPFLLYGWAIAGLWSLGLFHLHREATAARPAATDPPRDPYPSLFNGPFVVSWLLVVLTTLTLGLVIFLFMPRTSAAGRESQGSVAAKHLTGFTDEVRLGQMGEILENDAIVFSVEFADGEGRRADPPVESLWRGVALTAYEKGRWSRGGSDPIETRRLAAAMPSPGEVIRQTVKLEPTDNDVLFVFRPVLLFRSRTGGDPVLNGLDGTFYRRDLRAERDYEEPSPPRPGGYDYRVWSQRDPTLPQDSEVAPNAAQRRPLLAMPGPLREHLAAYAAPILRRASGPGAEDRALALEAHLRDTGEFTYSLRMDRSDPDLDPVEDFLIHRKTGHCEYFASALALLLRSVGIPSRMINGFKGGDYNDLLGVMAVREKHAHSWVEALVGQTDEGAPIWIKLDPTPGLEREAVVNRVGGSPRFRYVSDFVRHYWNHYVAGYDQEKQQVLYGWVRWAAALTAEGFLLLGRSIAALPRRLLYFENAESFFSVRGFLVSFFGLLILALGVRALQWLVDRVLGRFRDGPGEAALAAGVAFYHRLARLLAEAGLNRPDAETPREFARRAASFLSGRAPEAPEVADVPPRVVEAFYRVRFGHHELGPATLRDLEAQLDALEARLRPA